MRFPAWVDGPRKTKAQRATARLKFIIFSLSAGTERMSARCLAEKVGLDHSTISGYIRRGAFSPNAAAKIETALGRKTIRAEYLTDPLNIPTTA
jgi:hypothetical protein